MGIDLSFMEPVEEFINGKVHVHYLVCKSRKKAVWDGLRDPDLGRPCDVVREAFDMLDVHGGHDVDAHGEEFFDVLPAFLVVPARGVRMRQLIDQHEFWHADEDCIHVEVEQLDAFVLHAARGDLFKAFEEDFGFSSPVAVDDAGDDVNAFFLEGMCLLEHPVGLPDAWREAQEYLEVSPSLLSNKV